MIRFEDVFTMENLLQAYKNVRRGKKKQANVIKYHMNHVVNLQRLKQRLDDGTYTIGRLNRFRVYEPKEREVIADSFEDKIVQDIISKKVLNPLISPKVIYDNHASQPNKGTHHALKRLCRHMTIYAKSVDWSDTGWVMMGDISKFFYMIDHSVCWGLIDPLPIDDPLKRLIRAQIDTCTSEINPYTDEDGRGLCIGFQTSQWLAIYYLNKLDHFIKEELRVEHYGRYMDDFYLIHKDRAYLEYCFREIDRFISEQLNVSMNKKSHIHPFSQGICFLGYRAMYDTSTHEVVVQIRTKSINKMLKRVKKQVELIAQGKITQEDARVSLESWHAYAMHGYTKKADNAYRKARKMLHLDLDPLEEYLELRNNWCNLDTEDFFRLVYREDTTLRDSNGFVVLMPAKKSKREAWIEEKRAHALANPHKTARANFNLFMGQGPPGHKHRKRGPSKRTKAKRIMRKAGTELICP